MATWTGTPAVPADVGKVDSSGALATEVALISVYSAETALLRFPGVQIPAGATVTHAQLTVHNSNTVSDTAKYKTWLHDVDDAGALAAGDAAGPYTDAAVTSTTRPSSGTGAWPVTITAVMQEILDRPGWAAGNAMKALVKGTGSLSGAAAKFVGWDTGSMVPTLTVEYEPNLPLVADFDVAFNGLTVTVTDNSTDPDGTIAARAWDFGDGTTDTGQVASHTYAAAGSWTVTLTVTDNDGHTATTSHVVVVNQPPTVGFTYEVGPDGRTVTVDTTASHDPDGHTIARVIDFGDGYTSTEVVASHTYPGGGTVTVTVTVTDELGASSVASADVTLLGAAFTSRVVGLTGRFTDTTVLPSGRSVAAWAWDFGDGTTGSGPAPAHTYPGPGRFTVTMTATLDDGATDVATRTVETVALIDWHTDRPAWAAALAAPERTTTGMVEVIDDAGTVLATLGGPEHPGTPVVSGTVTCDGTRPVRWTADLAINDPTWAPARPGDLLHVLSHNRVRLWWLLRFPDGTWARLCVGTLYPGTPSITDGGHFAMTVGCADVVAEVRRALWRRRPLDVAGMTCSDAVAAIWADRAPYAQTRVTPTDVTLPKDYELGGPGADPWEDVERIAAAAGMVAYADRMGVLTLAPLRPAGPVVVEFVEGPGCEMTDLAREVTADQIANAVLVMSTSSDVEPPVYAESLDTDPTSPLRLDLGHEYTKVIESGEVTTTAQAQAMADQERARSRALVEQVEVTHRARPDLDPGDTVVVGRAQAGVGGPMQVTAWSVALGPGSGQRTTMTERAVTA